MTGIVPLSGATASASLALTPQGPSQGTQLRDAAKQFEAIFVRQMLAAAHAAKPAGEDGLFGGQAMDTFHAMQDERFAQIAADSGAFGLARQIETQLAAQLNLSREGASTGSARADQGASTTSARAELVEAPAQTSGKAG